MQLGAILLWGDDLELFRSRVRLAELLGYGAIGVGDSPAAWHELYVSLAVAGMETTSAAVTTMVTTPYLRHPTVTASAISAVDELTGGRARLAIGSGGSAMGSIGRNRGANVSDLREYVVAVRALLHGDAPEFAGTTAARLVQARPIPVYMGADGPKALRLAGEVADGVVIGVGMSLDIVEGKIHAVRAAATAAGRDPDTLTIWGMGFTSVRDDRQQAVDDIVPLLASTAGMGMKAPHMRALIPPELLPRFEELEQRYDATAHVVRGGKNAMLLQELGLVDFMVGLRGVTGSPAEVSTHFERLEGLGVSCLFVPTPGSADPEGTLTRVSQASVNT